MMNSVEKFLQASKLDDLCVTGTKIGEQAYLIANLNSPVFFLVGDSETAIKANQQLLALNKRSVIIDNIDNPYMITKYQSQDNNIAILNALYSMANNTLDVVVITPQVLTLKLDNFEIFKKNIINLKENQTLK